jgi:hypothetical protein
MGLLPRQLVKITKELLADGEITKDMDRTERALIVIGELATSEEYGNAWKAAAEPDWDAIMEIVMMILDFLMMFL